MMKNKTVEESSDRDREEQQQEGDSNEVPLAVLRRWEREVIEELVEGTDEEEEEVILKEELEELSQRHKAEMEHRKGEEQAQNLKLAQKCWEQLGKIKALGSRDGAALMSIPSI